VLNHAECNALTYFGSSDYHHVTSILLKQFIHPVTVIVFDHRPDRNIFYPKVACNSWISRSVESVNIINVIQFGVGKEAMKFPWKVAGNYRTIKGGRLKLYSQHVMPLLPKIIKSIYTENVYITFDKSCLIAQENASNWEEGRLHLNRVLEIITAIAKEKNRVC